MAQRLDCSVRTVRRRIADGTFPSTLIGGLRRVSSEDFERIVASETAFLQTDLSDDEPDDRESSEENSADECDPVKFNYFDTYSGIRHANNRSIYCVIVFPNVTVCHLSTQLQRSTS